MKSQYGEYDLSLHFRNSSKLSRKCLSPNTPLLDSYLQKEKARSLFEPQKNASHMIVDQHSSVETIAVINSFSGAIWEDISSDYGYSPQGQPVSGITDIRRIEKPKPRPKPVAVAPVIVVTPDPREEEERELRGLAAAREAQWAEEDRQRIRPNRDRTARRRHRERAIDMIEIAESKMPTWKLFLVRPFNWLLIRLMK